MEKDLNFDLGFTPEQYSQLQAEDGAGFKRTLFGDYTLKIVDGEILPSKNAQKPHNMVKVTFEVVKSYEERTAAEVGSQIDGLYGTANSPDYMQKRFKQLCEACKVSVGKSGIKFAQLLGKQFDASVIWELSDSGKIDEFGAKRFYVNSRVKCERAVGTPRPKTINPVTDSQKAVRYLDQGDTPAPIPSDPAPWAGGNSNGNGNGDNGHVEMMAAPTFVDETEVEAGAHDYRALYKLGGDDAESAKEELLGAGIDPDGPIVIENLTDDIKAKYTAKFAPPKKGNLKPLGGGAKTGTRQARS